MTKTNIQQSLFDVLETLEKAEIPYRNGLGMLLPWEDPADTLSKPYHTFWDIDAPQKRDKIALSVNRNETISSEDRPLGHVPALFYGKNIKRASHTSWNNRKPRYQKRACHIE